MSFYRVTRAQRPQPAAWIIYISILSDTQKVRFHEARGFPSHDWYCTSSSLSCCTGINNEKLEYSQCSVVGGSQLVSAALMQRVHKSNLQPEKQLWLICRLHWSDRKLKLIDSFRFNFYRTCLRLLSLKVHFLWLYVSYCHNFSQRDIYNVFLRSFSSHLLKNSLRLEQNLTTEVKEDIHNHVLLYKRKGNRS